ncbi:tRNA pseudouridine(13) synthase TruD [Morganella morganii]|uniref:tRNA pseudouridine(13) synthase TruD n=1 Tax=Morganella morganii TaxID=582 RepID=UPI001BDB25BF|nr:tRNA pseudouridine(13) synthase TruD [Morganella morganii]MBT0385373.1 tRNA pseudouridine(13) synthase TruD [Morganella morganii subsp. morganii]
MSLPVSYFHGKPAATGVLKAQPEDFLVQEDLGFEPDGDGEHVMVRIRKTGCNTRFVAEELAKFAKIAARAVSYAGLKDRHAVTEQWFCLQMPGKETPDFAQMQLEGCEVLAVNRQKRKLRIGALKGNQFTIVLRRISDRAATEQRLQQIAQSGVPNYFGEQRFGRNGQNLHFAQRWADGEISVKDRSKRGFYLSAARSAMFNAVADARLTQQLQATALQGDAVQLAGRGSWFAVQADELADVQQRLDNRELRITAPLPGKGDLGSQDAALAFETEQLAPWQSLWQLAEKEGADNTRRALMLYPEHFASEWMDDETVRLSFFLPAGSFATSVIREIIELEADQAAEFSE